ncbi:phBC6A51 family helix-turn-helix protein [Priestia megaterium]|uniref:phBC6A51 family helix-turn-helix protein n=1 Tax=Priestia megaterium TaxID=1404 RepID=UPI003241F5E4
MSIERLNPTELKALELILNKEKRTYDDISNELGITPRHLRRIRDKQDFKDALKDSVISTSAESMPAITKSLEKKAMAGDVNAMKLYFQIQGVTLERREVKSTVENVSENKQKTNEELEADIQELQQLINESKFNSFFTGDKAK